MKLFSAPIFCGIALGILFPYLSLSMIWVSSLLLFLLLFLNTLAVDKQKLMRLTRAQAGEIAVAQGLIFLVFPLLLTAIAALTLHDPDFVFGVAVSSLAPCALVNPMFARQRGGNVEVALWNVLLSTLLCPLATVPLLGLLGLNSVYIDSHFLFQYLLALTALPLLLSWLTSWLFPRVSRLALPALPWASSLLLACLMFILVGSSLQRVPIRMLLNQDFFVLLGVFVVADFGVFALVRKIAGLFYESKAAAESLALSVATRNFAVSASLMLFFHPKAALPSAIGLIVHCAFFQYLLWKPSTASQSSVVAAA